jgi:uncharacterized protein YkwD
MSYFSLKIFAELTVVTFADVSVDSIGTLELHNNIRKSIGLNEISWDQNLAAGSLSYSKVLSKTKALEHSKGNYGENLYIGTSSMIDAVNMWISEQKSYFGQKIGSGEFQNYGHYTQMVLYDFNARYTLR